MRYHVLATDYDMTIAQHGVVSASTIESLERARSSGRSLILVTGRELDSLLHVFPRVDLFDRVVAENGAVLYRPATREQRSLAEPPPPEFIQALQELGIAPLAQGKVIVATLRPNETAILEVIRDLGLELQVIFNHTAVMVLPSGINKASGLQAALQELGLSPHNCVGVGDAENDHAFLALTECSIAVANGLDALKKRVNHTTQLEAGEGVTELIGQLVGNDLNFLESVVRHPIPFGTRTDGSELAIRAYNKCVLIAGPSGAGKSTMATTFIEKLSELGYQFCIIDPEGDYLQADGVLALGDQQRPPTIQEVTEALSKPSQNVAVNLLGVSLKERPAFFESLLHHIQELRGRTGRPHWMIVDEVHHVIPVTWKTPGPAMADQGLSVVMITVEPEKLPREALDLPDLVIALGADPGRTLKHFGEVSAPPLETGEGVGWFWKTEKSPFVFRTSPPKTERQRHRRKYAEGELAPERSFYFRGAEGKLNLRAPNLHVFLQLAEGVDEDTWLLHLQNGDMSRWFRDEIKDPDLAAEIRKYENKTVSAVDSRNAIRSEIERRYIVAA